MKKKKNDRIILIKKRNVFSTMIKKKKYGKSKELFLYFLIDCIF